MDTLTIRHNNVTILSKRILRAQEVWPEITHHAKLNSKGGISKLNSGASTSLNVLELLAQANVVVTGSLIQVANEFDKAFIYVFEPGKLTLLSAPTLAPEPEVVGKLVIPENKYTEQVASLLGARETIIYETDDVNDIVVNIASHLPDRTVLSYFSLNSDGKRYYIINRQVFVQRPIWKAPELIKRINEKTGAISYVRAYNRKGKGEPEDERDVAADLERQRSD